MHRIWNHLLVLGLAGFALFFCSGCNFDIWANATGYDPEIEDLKYIVRCEPGTRTLQVYEQQLDGPFSDSRVEREIKVGSPINGKPCSVSTENQGRPFTASDAVDLGLLPSQAPASAAPQRAAGSSARLNDVFKFLVPLVFPPSFPLNDNAKLSPAACPPTLGSYLVNHLQGTVTSFGFCPLAVRREIQVRANPLQLAVTPDGATVLVTSYDSAVTFIDTATDTVTFTLNTPNYNPSGIAISPDGSRAYVTHYLDENPSLLVIDVPNRKLLSTIPLPYDYPRVVVVTPDGAQAWVNYYAGDVITVVDLLSSSISANLTPGGSISMGMAFNPTGTKAFVAASPGLLLVIDTASLTSIARIAVGPSPVDVVADPNGRTVYVNSATRSGTWWIDANKNQLKAAPAASTFGGSMGLVVF